MTDDPDQCQLFSLVLSRAQYQLVTAEDGQSALRQLATTTFDVVLTDFELPDASGFDIIAAAKQLPAPPRTVLMSNHLDLRVFWRDSGADAYYEKLDIFQLLKVIEQVLAPQHPVAA